MLAKLQKLFVGLSPCLQKRQFTDESSAYFILCEINVLTSKLKSNSQHIYTSYGVRSGFSNAVPQSIDSLGQATCTHLKQFDKQHVKTLHVQWNQPWERNAMRPPALKDHKLLADGPTFQCNWTRYQTPSALRDHSFMVNWGGFSK